MFMNFTLGFGELMVVKSSEIERKKTIRCMKHVNQPVINKPQKIRLTNTKKNFC